MPHPVTAEDKHSAFLAKARRLNRTKIFTSSNKAHAASVVHAEDFKDMCKVELNPTTTTFMSEEELEKKRKELQEKFEVNTYNARHVGEKPKEAPASLPTREMRDLQMRARRDIEQQDVISRKATFTPAGTIVKEARKLLHEAQAHRSGAADYVGKKIDRESMDSRAAAEARRPYDGNSNTDTTTTLASSSSLASTFFPMATMAENDSVKGPKNHLDDISNSLGFASSSAFDDGAELFNPKDARDLDSTFKLFGLQDHKPRKKNGGRGRRRQEAEVVYDANNPIPLNFTVQNMYKPKVGRTRPLDYEENQGLALADSIINDVKAKYSVTAVRSMYRRRKESELQDQQAAYSRNKKAMEADKNTLEWKKARIDASRKRKTGNIEDLNKSKEEEVEEVVLVEEEGEHYVVKGITLKQMSTDPFYKSNLEQDVRAKLREKRSVLLRANCIENEGSGPDSKLALQMLATALLRDIDGGIIPRAKEQVFDRVPSGDWEMILEPKVEYRDRQDAKTDYEFKLPRHHFDDDMGREKRLTTAPC
jgi:hypothetical protein